MIDTFPAEITAQAGERVAVSGGESDPTFYVQMPAEGACCADCGNYVWTVTNRRTCCLECYDAMQGSGMDRETKLYAGEVVVGRIDTIDMIIYIYREVPLYVDPRIKVPDLARYTLLDAMLCALSAEVRAAGWGPPKPRPVPPSPGEVVLREGVTYTGEDVRALEAKAEKERKGAHKRATTKPRRTQKFRDDPSLFSGAAYHQGGYDES